MLSRKSGIKIEYTERDQYSSTSEASSKEALAQIRCSDHRRNICASSRRCVLSAVHHCFGRNHESAGQYVRRSALEDIGRANRAAQSTLRKVSRLAFRSQVHRPVGPDCLAKCPLLPKRRSDGLLPRG